MRIVQVFDIARSLTPDAFLAIMGERLAMP
jgi:hypothetical protein